MSSPPRDNNGEAATVDEAADHLLCDPPSPPSSRGGDMLPVYVEAADDGDVVAPPFSWKKMWQFTGPGLLMSVAFLDPGNIEGDLQAGAIGGYSLLWLMMWATAVGLLIQLLSARLGVATGRHLAELCREEYPYWAGILLWVMTEVALIGADIQEVIGSAIAIRILSHGVLPLWAGVLITACDCFFFLFLENYGVRKIEAVFAVFISMMALAFAWMFVDTKPSGKELVLGLLIPKLSSKTIQQAVGIVGCVITPYNVFLHSALVQSRNINPKKIGRVKEALKYYSIESSVALLVSFAINLFVTSVFAVGFYGSKHANSVGLANAGEYLQEKYGGGLFPIYYLWGIGLLVAGQSSTITGTYAGQFIMGGFLDLQLKKWLRSLISRSCAIVPTVIVALVFKRSEATLDALNEWLNVLQSMQIPFSLIPLFTLVSKEQIMGVFKIGPALERVVWTVTALVMVINGYVLLDFFRSKINGFMLSFLVCTAIAAYTAFILYLISFGVARPYSWFRLTRSEGYEHAKN
ncbi:metal transporter Nramp3.2-like [Rhododendron vialii]|uniref:metal transporter Nramp3.2-like n=1 Tax=Rhododendron vialii TaxID=182163 RepID=UPI00265F3675|nr:metal transporter Nramp3.2-like [Rhododendron vialii]